jgi:hypothetical protein
MTQGPKAVEHGPGRGAERRVGAFLERELDDAAIVLHDLRVPGSRASIDHVVVAPSGVWVVDSRWHCELHPESVATGPDDLDGATSVDEVGRHVEVVANAVGGRATDVPIRAALCFPSENWNGDARPFWVDGVLVTFPPDLVERVRAAGPLDEETIGWIAARLALE